MGLGVHGWVVKLSLCHPLPQQSCGKGQFHVSPETAQPGPATGTRSSGESWEMDSASGPWASLGPAWAAENYTVLTGGKSRTEEPRPAPCPGPVPPPPCMHLFLSNFFPVTLARAGATGGAPATAQG